MHSKYHRWILEQLDEIVDEWHSGESSRSLVDVLGLSQDAYKAWAEKCELPLILDACAREMERLGEARPDPMTKIIKILNEAFKADPRAIRALVENRVPANNALSEHSACVVDHDNAVGMLGVINGVVGALIPKERVAASFSDTPDGNGSFKMLGFVSVPSGDPDKTETTAPVELVPFSLKAAQLRLAEILGETKQKTGSKGARTTEVLFLYGLHMAYPTHAGIALCLMSGRSIMSLKTSEDE